MTNPPLYRRRLLLALILPAAAVLAGCATTASPEADRAALQQRAREYWELTRTNDILNAWKYEAASKDQSMTLEGYVKRGGITYDSVEVQEVRSLQGDEAKVDVRMRFNIPLLRLKNQETVAHDQWRRIDGVWYHVLPPSSAFPGAQRQ